MKTLLILGAGTGGTMVANKMAHHLDHNEWRIIIVDRDENWLTVDVKNRFETGDLLQLMTTAGNTTFELPAIIDRNGETTDAAPGSGHVVKIPVPEGVDPGAIDEFSLLIRYLPG